MILHLCVRAVPIDWDPASLPAARGCHACGSSTRLVCTRQGQAAQGSSAAQGSRVAPGWGCVPRASGWGSGAGRPAGHLEGLRDDGESFWRCRRRRAGAAHRSGRDTVMSLAGRHQSSDLPDQGQTRDGRALSAALSHPLLGSILCASLRPLPESSCFQRRRRKA